ncbi:MAG TPA: hypothetical protein VEH53_08430, partial [archaeon]|nr:hypothetical protein [archaeon]
HGPQDPGGHLGMMLFQAMAEYDQEIRGMDLFKASGVGTFNESGRDVIQSVKGGIEMNRSCVQSPRCDASEEEQLLVGDTPRGPNAYGLAGVPETDALKPCSQVGKCFFPRYTRQRPI